MTGDPGGPLLVWLHKPVGGAGTATLAVRAGDYTLASTDLPYDEATPYVPDVHLNRLGYRRVGPWTPHRVDRAAEYAKAVER